MTKAQYLEMCEQLGTEPLESQTPVEFEDFPVEVQEALKIYSGLQDCWDYMGGNYIGKNLNNFSYVMELYGIENEDRKLMYEMILEIDQLRAKQIQDSKPKDQKAR